MTKNDRLLRIGQWILIAAGIILLGFWATTRIQGARGKNEELRRFETARNRLLSSAVEPTPAAFLPTELPVDTSLWARNRIDEFNESMDHEFDPALAVLRIPSIDLEVPVLAGTTELVLNRAVGHIAGTPLPGDTGNVGIAGHRDGYFRRFKDLEVGDSIELETLIGYESYTIAELLIVQPEDVWVLDPTEKPSITLVTCYPFYFVGSAPQRFIVRAEREGTAE